MENVQNYTQVREEYYILSNVITRQKNNILLQKKLVTLLSCPISLAFSFKKNKTIGHRKSGSFFRRLWSILQLCA